jgi:hypothetical protein
MMKAIVQHGYDAPDEVLKLAEVDTPAVGDQELLVRVKASSANPWDWHFIRGEPVLMRPAGHCLIATFRSVALYRLPLPARPDGDASSAPVPGSSSDGGYEAHRSRATSHRAFPRRRFRYCDRDGARLRTLRHRDRL